MVAEVYIEIHMLRIKDKVSQDCWSVTVLSMHLFAGMAVYFIFFSVYYIDDETWNSKKIFLNIPAFYKYFSSWF